MDKAMGLWRAMVTCNKCQAAALCKEVDKSGT